MSSINMPSYGQEAIPPVQLSSFRETAQKFVASAKKVANVILHPAASNTTADAHVKSKRHIHHHHHHGYGYSSFWHRPTYIIAPYSSYRGERDGNEQALRWAVGTIGAVVGAVAFYAIGSFIKNYKKVEKRLADNQTFKNELVNRLSSEPAELVEKLGQIATLRERILNRTRGNNAFNLAAVVTLATSCTIATVGAVLGAPAAMAGGTLLGLGCGAVTMVRWGMDNTESKQKRDANALLNAVNQLPAY